MSEDEAFRDSIRTALDRELPSTRVRAALDLADGFDAGLWKLMCDLGWLAIHIPERYGGLGGRFAETCFVLQELSRKLAPSPYFSSAVLASAALLGAKNEVLREKYLPKLAAGDVRGAFAFGGKRGQPAEIGFRCVSKAGTLAIGGRADFVLDAHLADFIIIHAHCEAGRPVLYLIETSRRGADVALVEPVDLTRRFCRVSLDNVPVNEDDLIAGPDECAWLVDHMVKAAGIGLASECVGGAEQVLNLTVDYVKTREQFGRPIGSFQAVKHGCAEMLLQIETARAAAEHAAQTVTLGETLSSNDALIAKAIATEAYCKVAGSGMQYHGGIGFTWEHDMHLHFKRAALARNLFGLPGWHLDQLAASILEGPASFAKAAQS